jgi:hypothetical protein
MVARVPQSGGTNWPGGACVLDQAEFAAWLGATAAVGGGNRTTARRAVMAMRGWERPGMSVVTSSDTAVASGMRFETAGGDPGAAKCPEAGPPTDLRPHPRGHPNMASLRRWCGSSLLRAPDYFGTTF